MRTNHLFLVLSAVAALFSSCTLHERYPNRNSQSTEIPLEQETIPYSFKLKLNTLADGTINPMDKVSEIHASAYMETGDGSGSLLSEYFASESSGDNIKTDATGVYNFTLDLPAMGTKKILLSLNNSNGSNGTESAKLGEVTNSRLGANPGALIFSGTATVASASDKVTVDVEVKRMVARIDVNPGTDSKVEISSVQYSGGTDRGYVFPQANGNIVAPNWKPVEAKNATYRKTFDKPLSGNASATATPVLYVCETDKDHPGSVTVQGTYLGTSFSVTKELPSLERNKVYTISMTKLGTTVTGQITVKPWENGEIVEVSPTK